MSPDQKKEKELSLNERTRRWDDIRRAQMAVTNNLFITLGIALCAYINVLYKTSTCDFMLYSFYCSVASILFGALLTLFRLLDFKFTARKVHAEKDLHFAQENNKKAFRDEMVKYKGCYKKMGCLSWWMLSMQNASLSACVVLFACCIK